MRFLQVVLGLWWFAGGAEVRGAAQPLTPGVVVSGAIQEPGARVAYTVNGVRGQRFYFDGLPGNDVSIAVRLVSPSGLVLFDVDSRGDYGPFSLYETGVHRLEVDGRQAAVGEYAFRLVDLDGLSVLSPGRVSSQLVPAAATQLYVIQGIQGQVMDLNRVSLSGGSASWLLYGPDNKLMVSGGLGQNLGKEVLWQSGRYLLVVQGNGSAAVGASYEVEVLVSGGAAGPSEGFGEVYSGTVTGSTNLHTFTGRSGTVVYLDSLLGGNSQAIAELRDPTGTNAPVFSVIASQDGGPHVLPMNGQYTLRVRGTGAYRLRLLNLSDAPQMDLDGETVGAIGAFETRVFRMPAVAGQRFLVDGIDGVSSVRLRLLSSGLSGFWVNQTADRDSGLFRVTDSGVTYWFVDNSVDSGAEYRFRVFDVDRVPVLSLGRDLESGVMPGSAMRLYRYDGFAGERLYFSGLGSAGGSWSFLGPDSRSLGGNSWNGNFEVTLQDDGVHVLLFDGTSAAGTAGSFVGRVHAADQIVTPLTVGSTVEGAVTKPGDVMEYRFVGVPGQRIQYDSLVTEQQRLSVQLRTPADTVVYLNTSAQFDQGPHTLVDGGTYRLLVFGSGGATGRFNFVLRDLALVPELTYGTVVSNRMESRGASIIYRFSARQGDRLYLDAQGEDGGTWTVYSPENDTLGGHSWGIDMELALTRTGTHLLQFTSQRDTPVSHQFRLLKGETSRTVLVPGVEYSGRFETPAQIANFEFDGQAGQRFFYDALEGDFQSINSILTSPSGRVIHVSGNADSDAGPFYLEETGRYVLSIDPGSDVLGSYRFRWVEVGGPQTEVLSFDRSIGNNVVVVPSTHLQLTGSYINGSLRTVVAPADWRSTQVIAGTRQDSPLNFRGSDWGARAAVGLTNGFDSNWDQFSVQWDGTVRVPVDGTHLYLRSDDGSRLWIDLNRDGVFANEPPELVVNGWGNAQSTRLGPGSVALPAGTYAIRIQYEEEFGNNTMELLWDEGVSLDPGRGVRFYKFEGVQGMNLFIDSTYAGFSGAMYLYSPGSETLRPIASVGFGGDLELTLPSSGTYFLAITSGSAEPVPYSVRVTQYRQAVGALTLGAMTQGLIARPGDTAAYTFRGSRGQRLYYDGLEGEYDSISATLIDPNGDVVWSRNSDDDFGPFTLLEEGTYTLVFDGSGDTLGNFAFRLIDVEGAGGRELVLGRHYGVTPVPASALDVTGSYINGSLRGYLPQDDWRTTQKVAGTRKDSQILFETESWGARAAVGLQAGGDSNWEDYSVQWDGIWSNPDADARLSVLSDDGSRLWVDLNGDGLFGSASPELVVHGWGSAQSPTFGPDSVGFPAGSYRIRLQYEEGTGWNRCVLYTDQGDRVRFDYGAEVFRFSGVAGERLFLDAQGPDSSGNWTVYSPNNTPLASTALTSDLALTLPSTGRYLLVARSYRVGGARYAFSLRRPAAPVRPVEFGRDVLASINTPGDVEVYEFDAAQGDRFFLDTTEWFTGTVYTKVESASGELITNLSPSQDSGQFTTPSAGRYRVVVYGSGDAVGSTRFRLVKVADLPSTAPGLLASVLVPGARTDVHAIDLLPGDRLDLSAVSYRDGTAYWYLYPPSGQAILSAWIGNDLGRWVAPERGRYLVAIAGADNRDSGAEYSVRISKTSQPGVGTTGLGEVLTGRVAGETNVVVFQASAGKRIILDALGPDEGGVVVRIVDSTGTNVTVAGVRAGSDAGPFVLPVSGTHQVQISGTGSYAFRLLDLSAAPFLGADGVGRGSMEPFQLTIFRVQARPGQRFYYDSRDAVRFSGTVRLWDPAWNLASLNQPISNDQGPFEMTREGEHFLQIDNPTPIGGEYDFRLLDVAGAPVLPLGVETSVTLESAQGVRIYRHAGKAGQRFYFNGRGTVPGGVWLYDAENRYVAGGDWRGDFELPLTADGDYMLVLSPSGQGVGPVVFVATSSFPTAEAIRLGTGVSGNLAQPGEVHEYTFTGSVGQRLFLDRLEPGNNPVPFRLLSPTGVQVHVHNTGSDVGPFTLVESGSYRLRAEGRSGAALSYAFVMRDLADAPLLVAPTVVSNRVESGRAALVYQFEAVAGERMYLDSQVTGTPGFWVLYGPSDGNINSVGLAGDLEFDVERSGRHVVVVHGQSDAPFSMQFGLVRSDVRREEIQAGQLVRGTIQNPGGQAEFSFNGTAGQVFYYDSLTPGSEFAQVWLQDPDGNVRYINGNSVNDSGPFTLLAGGKYRLVLNPSGESTPEYAFRLLDLGTQPLLPVGAEVRTALDPGLGARVFRYVPPADATLYFQMVSNAVPGSAGTWTLLSSRFAHLGGQQLRSDFEVEVEGGRDVYLVLSSQTDAPMPLVFRVGYFANQTEPLVLGRIIEGRLSEPGEKRSYGFTAQRGQRLLFDGIQATNPVPFVRLISPRGNAVYLNGHSAGSDVGPFTITEPGEYFLVVDGSGGSTGNYSFRLVDVGVQPLMPIDTVVSGVLDPGQTVEVRRVVGLAGRSLYFDGLGTNTAVRWSLLNPSLQVVAGAVATQDFELTLPIDGIYTLLIDGGAAGPAAYSVRVLTPDDDDVAGATPPTITQLGPQTVVEDGVSAEIPFSVGDLETPASALVVGAFSSNGQVVPDQNILIAGSGANRVLRFSPAPGASGTASITVVVTDGTGLTALTTFQVTVTPVNDAPVISSIADQVVQEGSGRSTVVFRIGDAESQPAGLRVDVTGANPVLVTPGSFAVLGTGADRVLTVAPIPGQVGSSRITVTVTDPEGLTAASSFVLTVTAVAPVITQQPLNQTVTTLGATVTFDMAARGTGPLAYQWRLNGQPIPGATSPQLNLTQVGSGQAGGYSVVVSSPYGTVTSRTAQLSVLVPPVITAQPQGQSVGPGSTVTLTVVASGNAPLSYQWRKNGINIAGANGSTLTLNNVGPADAGTYQVGIGSPTGGVASDEALVAISMPALGFSDGFAQRVRLPSESGLGKGSTVGATREAGEPLHAGRVGGRSVWVSYVSSRPGILRMDTRGSSFDTLLAVYTGTAVTGLQPVVSDEDGGGFFASALSFNVQAGVEYAIAVDGLAGAQGVAALTWEFSPTPVAFPRISREPANVTVATGAQAVFEVVAVNPDPLNPGLVYQWYHDGVLITGATTPVLVIPSAQAVDLGLYTAEVNNGVFSVFSQPAFLQISVNDPNVLATGVTSEDKLANSTALGAAPGPAGRARGLGRSPRPDGGVASGYSGTQIFSTYGSTTELGEPNHCGVVGGASQWFSYSPANSGVLSVSTDGSDFDTVLAIYTAEGAGFTGLRLVACDDNGGADGRDSLVRFNAQAGVVYFVVVDGVNGATGNVPLTYALSSPLDLANAGVVGGNFEFDVRGGLGSTYQVQSSPDLAVWTTVRTTHEPTGAFRFSDPVPASPGPLFYRVVSLP